MISLEQVVADHHRSLSLLHPFSLGAFRESFARPAFRDVSITRSWKLFLFVYMGEDKLRGRYVIPPINYSCEKNDIVDKPRGKFFRRRFFIESLLSIQGYKILPGLFDSSRRAAAERKRIFSIF